MLREHRSQCHPTPVGPAAIERGFSLIETMVVVAILSIVAAVAIPPLLPEIHKAQLEVGGESVGAFVGVAQTEAMSSGRCVRLRIFTVTPVVLVAERLNAYDCDVDPATAPLIDDAAPLWIEFSRMNVTGSRLSIAFGPAPSESGAATAAGSAAGTEELRFRPSGRLFSADDNAADDDGALVLTHALLAATGTTKAVVVEAQGLICVLRRGTSPGAGPNLSCPTS